MTLFKIFWTKNGEIFSLLVVADNMIQALNKFSQTEKGHYKVDSVQDMGPVY